MNKIEILKKAFVFQNMSDEILKVISENMTSIGLKKGGKVFSEGEPADGFYVVETGEIIISKTLSPEKEKILAVIKDGALFGEMAFFSNSPRIATAYAKSDTKIWKIDREEFFAVIGKHPEIGLKVFSALLHVAMERLEQTSRELATIYETGRIISSAKTLNEIIGAISDELIVAIPPAEHAAIFVYNEFNMEYENQHYPELPANDPFVLELKTHKDGFLVNAGSQFPAGLPEHLKEASSFIVAPISKSSAPTSQPVGFISLWNKTVTKPFSNSHLLLLISVAGQLSEAIGNLRYLEEEKNRRRLKNR